MSNTNDDLTDMEGLTQQPTPRPSSYNPERIAIGSHHEVRLPVSVQPASVLEPTPEPIPPPPPALTPKPVLFPPPTQENLRGMIPLPVSIRHIQDEKEEKEEETEETFRGKLGSTASWHFKELGQVVGTLLSSLKNKSENLRRLRAEKEVLTAQLKESEEQNVFLSDRNDEVVKKCEDDVEKAKSEETIYRNKYVELSEQLTAVKKESLEKNLLIESLREKISESEMTISEQKAKIETLEITENKLKKEAIKKEKSVLLVEERYRKKCHQNVKLVGELNDIRAQVTDLQSNVKQFVECDKEDKTHIRNLEGERDALKISFEELQAQVSKKTGEISNISRELEKERKDNRYKLVELEKTARKISDLTKKVKVLEKEKHEFPSTLDKIMNHARNSLLQLYPQKQSSAPSSSSSSGKETSPELSSVAAMVNENAEQLEAQEDVTRRTTPVKRKHSTATGTVTKQCADDGHDGQLSFEGISQIYFNKKFTTGRDNELPEARSYSKSSSSSSSRRKHRSREGRKQ